MPSFGSTELAVRVNAREPRVRQSDIMKMTRIEKRFVNEIGHSRKAAQEAVRRLRHIPVQTGWSYLDVGCGNGAAALRVADTFGMHVAGVDVDPQQIAPARSATGGRTDVLFMTADATCLPFDDRRFDIVATNKTTHHVPQWLSAIAEMRRVLKPHAWTPAALTTSPIRIVPSCEPF
jgi:ubiquinone/menaquinone biosynthesis C-methylase UbiE